MQACLSLHNFANHQCIIYINRQKSNGNGNLLCTSWPWWQFQTMYEAYTHSLNCVIPGLPGTKPLYLIIREMYNHHLSQRLWVPCAQNFASGFIFLSTTKCQWVSAKPIARDTLASQLSYHKPLWHSQMLCILHTFPCHFFSEGQSFSRAVTVLPVGSIQPMYIITDIINTNCWCQDTTDAQKY